MVWYCEHLQQSMDQPGMVNIPVCAPLNRVFIFPCPHSRLGLRSRDTGSAVESRVIALIINIQLNLLLSYEP